MKSAVSHRCSMNEGNTRAKLSKAVAGADSIAVGNGLFVVIVRSGDSLGRVRVRQDKVQPL